MYTDKSSRTNSSLAVVLAVASMLLGHESHAAINFDKLTACDDIARLQATLNSAIGRKPAGCRAPRGDMERAIEKRSALGANILCFQASSPVAALQGFSCMRPEVPTGASLVCFREAALSDVKSYKEQYGEKFAAPASRYMAAAAKCSASNGDTSTAIQTGFPMLLSFISRFEFGFITLLGKQRLTDSSVIHGYAATDPSAGSNVPSAIEFFSLFVGAEEYVRAGVGKTVGEWTARIDDNAKLDAAANAEFRKRNAPMMMDTTTISLTRRTTASLTQQAKLALLKDFQKAIASAFEDEGFKLVSDAELKAKSGRNSQETIAEIAKSMAFGANDMPVKMGPDFFVLVNERQPACTRNGNGAMAAYLMSTQPVADVRSDYGSVGIIIAGLGACSRTSSSVTRTYVNGLIEEANNTLLKALERR